MNKLKTKVANSAQEFDKPRSIARLAAGWYVNTNPNMKRKRIDIRHRLPDGTRLTDQCNSHLLEALERCAYAESERLNDSSMQGHDGFDVLAIGYRFVQWMKLNGFERFSEIPKSSVRTFLLKSVQGIDAVLDATPRFAKYLIKTLRTDSIESIKSKGIKHHLGNCGIPPHLIKTLDGCRNLFAKATSGLPFSMEDCKVRRNHLVTESVYHICSIVELLWSKRELLPDSLVENPLPETPQVFANQHGARGGHTATIPIQTGAIFIAKCIEWVLIISPELLKVHRAIKARNGKSGNPLLEETPEGVVFNEWAAQHGWSKPLIGLRRDGRNGIEYRSAIRTYLLTACAVVILAFTARRDIEIRSLKCNCITGPEGKRLITHYVGKRRMWDETPCPEVVVRAVEVVRSIYGEPEDSQSPLFERRDVSEAVRGITPANMNAFTKYLQEEEQDSNSLNWKFAKHQFRRFFAMVYVWRWELPCLLSLQHHLRHLHAWMTRVYFSDERIEEFLDESRRLTANKLRQLATGEVVGKGTLGKKLQRQVERIGTIQLMDEEAVIQFARDRKIVLKGTQAGYCGASARPSNLRRAACHQRPGSPKEMDTLLGGPLASASSEEVCAGCQFFMTDDSREAHWTELAGKLEKASEASSPTPLLEALRARLRKVGSFVRNNFAASA